MANLEDLSRSLDELLKSESYIFCSWNPEKIDSTSKSKIFVKFKIETISGKMVQMNLHSENVFLFLKLFEAFVSKKNIPLIGHDWKQIFTLFTRLTGKNIVLKNVFDLLWYESYLAKESSISEISRQERHFKEWVTNKVLISIYKKVFQPIICEVIPAIESYCLIDDNIGQLVYPNYHIEGQENGRLSCSCEMKRCYNPHSLGDYKSNFRLLNQDHIFFQFDYRSMEVGVLACLAEDEVLQDIINNNSDSVYEIIFQKVFNVASENAKDIAKKTFLPIIYGQTAAGLARNLEISFDQAQIYFDIVRKTFSKSFDYVEGHQDLASKNEFVKDKFGRKRFFDSKESYKARNFAIQSPAALICLESLVKLYKQSSNLYQIVYSVHDGYCLAVRQKDMQDAYMAARSILEKQTELIPELKLSVSVMAGKSLDKMQKLKRKAKN